MTHLFCLFLVERTPINYYSSIPAVPEFGPNRSLGPSRLREIRKALDNGHAIPDIESIAQECMEEIVELCSGESNSLT